jgi:hypothetical protein
VHAHGRAPRLTEAWDSDGPIAEPGGRIPCPPEPLSAGGPNGLPKRESPSWNNRRLRYNVPTRAT